MRENGVFLIKEKGNSALAVKLPLHVDIGGDRVKVCDEDISAVSKSRVTKRQAALTQVVDLLYNPLNVEMSSSRKQHLIWVLFQDVFNKFGFKSPTDKYFLR
jgi:hypothetical protein